VLNRWQPCQGGELARASPVLRLFPVLQGQGTGNPALVPSPARARDRESCAGSQSCKGKRQGSELIDLARFLLFFRNGQGSPSLKQHQCGSGSPSCMLTTVNSHSCTVATGWPAFPGAPAGELARASPTAFPGRARTAFGRAQTDNNARRPAV
jgi:hypothetical protein